MLFAEKESNDFAGRANARSTQPVDPLLFRKPFKIIREQGKLHDLLTDQMLFAEKQRYYIYARTKRTLYGVDPLLF